MSQFVTDSRNSREILRSASRREFSARQLFAGFDGKFTDRNDRPFFLTAKYCCNVTDSNSFRQATTPKEIRQKVS